MSPRMRMVLILATVFGVNSVKCGKPNIVIILADDLVNLFVMKTLILLNILGVRRCEFPAFRLGDYEEY